MVDPRQRLKRVWDMVAMVAIVYAAVELPLRLTLGYPLEGMALVFDRLVVLIFTIDIVLNFNTAVIGSDNPSKIVSSRPRQTSSPSLSAVPSLASMMP